MGPFSYPWGAFGAPPSTPALPLSPGPAGPTAPAPRPPSFPGWPGPVSSPDLVGARAVHGAPSRPAAPRSSGRSPLVPPRGRGPDLRNGGGAEPPPSAPTVAARPRAAAPPPCARPGALPHGASWGGARGALRVRACLRRKNTGLCAGATGTAEPRASAPDSKPSGKCSPPRSLAFRRRAEGASHVRACGCTCRARRGVHGAGRRNYRFPFLHSRNSVLRGSLREIKSVSAPQGSM